MTDENTRGSGSLTPRDATEADTQRDALNPSPDGVANWLVRGVARGHGNMAIAIAVVASFAVVGVLIVGLGLLITHVLEHGSIGVWDHHVSQWLDRRRTRQWDRITGDITDVADTFEVAGVGAVVTIFLLFRRWGRRAFLLVAGLAIELSVFLAANKIVARPRPAVSHLGGTPSTFSFPSGHTAATVVLYGGIAVIVTVASSRRWPRITMWALAVVLAVAVGLSRVYRGEHYPTDVLSGLLLGVGSLSAGIFIIRVAGVNRSTISKSTKIQISPASAGRANQAAP
ncbi:MAG: rane-associated phospholipid phosphatase [Acidimicrobiaceae bacterium]|nr:rane-associated phospholipid phosphatase [Acidimicrobiaceae bacterium]